ncbi:MAG TPA: 3-octaprenyl-4-hydroxybenzoate carboxy-lyase, partial [Gemmataceae bacterium]|nr:3-octaprenyl-4-hydroxybenzoate carboxy-lyase [Gemmataceae bacterium]
MGYRNLRACLADLDRTGQLGRIEQEIDPCLEMAAVHLRVHEAGGPAVYFARVKGCDFPAVSYLFGTPQRSRFLFRDTLAVMRRLVGLKVDPAAFWKSPWAYRGVPGALLHALPKRTKGGPIIAQQTTVTRLPQI